MCHRRTYERAREASEESTTDETADPERAGTPESEGDRESGPEVPPTGGIIRTPVRAAKRLYAAVTA